MNDEFLHQLRVHPPALFAARLKARLDTKSAIAAAKRRVFKWYVLCGLLLGTTAVALIVPSVRTAIASLVHWHSKTPGVSETTDRAAASSVAGGTRHSPFAEQTNLALDAPSSQKVGDERPRSAPIESGISGSRTAGVPSQETPAPLVPASRRIVRIAVTPQAEGAVDKMITAFEAAYGYEVRRETRAPGCSRWPLPDVFVTIGRISANEDSSCRKIGLELITTPVAYDAYVAIVNRENTWAQSLTIDDLRTLAEPPLFPNPLATWDQLRPDWPSLPINVLGLSSTLGTVGETFIPVRSVRGLPFVIDKDDADIVKMIDASYGGLGFMRFATYIEQLEQAHGALPVRALGIVSESNEIVLPSSETVQSGRYDTLSRPLLVHLNPESLKRMEVAHFGTHAVEAMPHQLSELGYVGIDKLTTDTAARKLRALSSRPR